MKTPQEILRLCDRIRESSFSLPRHLRHGHLDGELIVELKACKCLTDEHIAQLLGYLRGCRIQHGLLINFGSGKFEVRKYILSEAV